METTLDEGNKHLQKQRPHGLHVRSIDNVACYILTTHAQMRAAQRGLVRQDIDYVLCYGHLSHTGGAEIYFLRNIDIPNDDRRYMKRLEGTAVIVARNPPRIITVWRNAQHGSRNIRHKLAQIWHQERLILWEGEIQSNETDKGIDAGQPSDVSSYYL